MCMWASFFYGCLLCVLFWAFVMHTIHTMLVLGAPPKGFLIKSFCIPGFYSCFPVISATQKPAYCHRKPQAENQPLKASAHFFSLSWIQLTLLMKYYMHKTISTAAKTATVLSFKELWTAWMTSRSSALLLWFYFAFVCCSQQIHNSAAKKAASSVQFTSSQIK